MEKGGGKRCKVGKNNGSDCANSNMYEGHLGCQEITQMMKDHDISIRHLEERMNHLASQMRLDMSVKEKEQLMENVTPSPKDVDKEDIKQNIKETLFKEFIRSHSLE
ncbi:hypothetical protein HAX54_011840 [Datura stramonium]|uniref:Uncharacterized protein n=1 Tax=Datura stramonium TaxID=4076 RepID=A0ABS8RXH4_DATST|nr:hypothetical protein [Datura stramonium]